MKHETTIGIIAWVIVVLGLILLCNLPAMAQEPNPYEKEPSRVRYKLPKVATVDGQKCLSAEQWNQVILIASEYKGLFEWRLKIEPTLLAYDALKNAYDRDIDILEREIQLLKDNREYLELRLGQAETARTKFRKSYKLEKGIMWAVIAVETVVIGILGIKGTAN